MRKLRDLLNPNVLNRLALFVLIVAVGYFISLMLAPMLSVAGLNVPPELIVLASGAFAYNLKDWYSDLKKKREAEQRSEADKTQKQQEELDRLLRGMGSDVNSTVRDSFNTLRRQFPITGPDSVLKGRNFDRADWTGLVIRDANLAGSVMKEIKLVEVDMPGVDLSEVDLTGARIRNANLCGANLQNAKLDSANLHEVKLPGSNLHGASIEAARLWNIDLQNAEIAGLKWAEARTEGYLDFRDTNLDGVDFSHHDLKNSKFQGVSLKGANLEKCNLMECWFTGADLSNANFKGANLNQARFQDADLSEANLAFATLYGVDFTDTRLDGTNFQFCRGRPMKPLTQEQQATIIVE